MKIKRRLTLKTYTSVYGPAHAKASWSMLCLSPPLCPTACLHTAINQIWPRFMPFMSTFCFSEADCWSVQKYNTENDTHLSLRRWEGHTHLNKTKKTSSTKNLLFICVCILYMYSVAFLFFYTFVTLKCFSSSNKFKYQTKITEVKTTCSFYVMLSFIKGTLSAPTSIWLYVKT